MSTLDHFLQHDYEQVVRSVSLVCGSVDEAEDAVQTALAITLDQQRRGKLITNLPAWIFVVASNASRRRFRRRQSEQRSMQRLATMVPSAETPGSEPLHELWQAVKELPPRQQQAIVLFYLHDLDIRSIAHLLKVSEGTVKTALHRARQTLATRLTSDKEADHAR